MQYLFDSGHIVDLILFLMVIEALGLIIYHRRTGRGLPVVQVVSSLAAGIFLFLALRLALTGAGWPAIGGALVAALLAHAADLTSRWRSG